MVRFGILVGFVVAFLGAIAGEIPRAQRPCAYGSGQYKKFQEMFERQLQVGRQGGAPVVFLGDSITYHLLDVGKDLWRKHFVGGKYRAVNFGMPGDSTGNVIYRIQNGLLDDFQAKVIVFMLGTNNLAVDSPDEIFDALKCCLELIRIRQPRATIVLSPIPLCCERPNSPLRMKAQKVNARLPELVDGQKVLWCEWSHRLLRSDGVLTWEVMFDNYHPREVGYAYRVEALLQILDFIWDPVGKTLNDYTSTGRISGVVSMTSESDYSVKVNCAGWANVEEKRPMTADTLFAVFSMTKTFTGAALMAAIDGGRISLDDRVSIYLPEFKEVKVKVREPAGGVVLVKPKRELTIRDLMSHMTGSDFGIHVVKRARTIREVARAFANVPLEVDPGKRFKYGNASVETAAACLEVAVGMSYEEWLQKKILDPLEMKDTTFWPSKEQQKRLVCAYNSDGTPLRRAADDCSPQLDFSDNQTVYAAAAGGLYSTPDDMIHFTQMLAHHGTWNERTIISRETFDKVFAVKQTPSDCNEPYTVGGWLYGDWFGHEGAMRTDQRANLKTGQCRLFFINTENKAGPAFFSLKRDWHAACDFLQDTPAVTFEN